MIVVTISALVYFYLIVLAPALLWKSTNRLLDSRALKNQIRQPVNAARISRRRAVLGQSDMNFRGEWYNKDQ
jgi:hypothetical protein